MQYPLPNEFLNQKTIFSLNKLHVDELLHFTQDKRIEIQRLFVRRYNKCLVKELKNETNEKKY